MPDIFLVQVPSFSTNKRSKILYNSQVRDRERINTEKNRLHKAYHSDLLRERCSNLARKVSFAIVSTIFADKDAP